MENASRIVGRNIAPGSIVVYESTIYPGVTEDICIPIIEKESGLKCGVDWKIGYSPERINLGDKVHRLTTIKKIVSGMDEETLEIVAKVYELVVEAGVHRASSIKVAEAAKVIENSQRDINIAFMNELSIIFHKMGIDMKEVLEAAGTKGTSCRSSPDWSVAIASELTLTTLPIRRTCSATTARSFCQAGALTTVWENMWQRTA